MNQDLHNSPIWKNMKRIGYGLCVLGILAAYLGWTQDPERFFQSYLMSWFFWIGLSLGGLAYLLLHHMIGSSWGVIIQRILEGISFGLIPLGLLFIPMFFGLEHVYPWARPEEVAADAHLAHRTHYLNEKWFTIRYMIYFVVWVGMWVMIQAMTSRTATEQKEISSKRLRILSAPALLFLVLTGTFASVDWGMSLEKDWMSMIYGLIFLISGILGALAFSIWLVGRFAAVEPLKSVTTKTRLHDLGNFLLTFVLVWAYFSFSQLIIIWYGNVPEDSPWLIRRITTEWQFLALIVCLFHFAVPFLLLLNRALKQNVARLGAVAAAVFMMRPVENFWFIKPAFSPDQMAFHWLDLALFLGIGGFWLVSFTYQFGRRPALPIAPEHFQEVGAHD